MTCCGHQRCRSRLANARHHGLPVIAIGGSNTYFDEFVVSQRSVNFHQHISVQPVLSDSDDGLQAMSQGLEAPALLFLHKKTGLRLSARSVASASDCRSIHRSIGHKNIGTASQSVDHNSSDARSGDILDDVSAQDTLHYASGVQLFWCPVLEVVETPERLRHRATGAS